MWNSFFAISGKVNIRRCAGNWTIEFSHLPWKWRRSLLLERDWGSELVIGGIMDCSSSSSTAVPVIVGGPWYIYGDCLLGGLGPVQGAWEPPSTLSASPIVVWRRSYRGLLNSSLDLGPNWKTNCGLHTYREPGCAARNKQIEKELKIELKKKCPKLIAGPGLNVSKRLIG